MASRIFGLVLLAIGTYPAAAIDANPTDPAKESLPPPGFPAAIAASRDGSPPAGVAFEPASRAVSNWRIEAIDNLDLSQETKTALTGGADVSEIPRCVKLNNYWCIKRARWGGEIAADTEGHVAFASAIDGAIAAAMLLRRYYLDYKRRSALAILSRWAPAQCAGVTAAGGRSWKPPAARLVTFASDAPHGIQNTLRARWLAAHKRGFARPDDRNAVRRSIVPTRPLALMRAPEIAVGMGEPQRAPAPIVLKKLAALEFTAPATEIRGTACTGENTRIQNYASRAIEGVAASQNDDLNLFQPDGTASANLSRVLENMAKVEIGPLAARAGLIAAAIDRLTPPSLAAGTPPPGGPHGGDARAQQ